MSNIVSALVRQRVIGSATLKSVLLFMADCASDDGSGIWISKSHMADDLELSRRAVQLAVQHLVQLGLVVETGKRGRSNGYTIEYAIRISAVRGLESTRSDSKSGDDATCERGSHVNVVRMPCERGSHQSANEVHINHPSTIHKPDNTPLGFPDAENPGKAGKATHLPDDWSPSAENIADGLSRQFSQEEIRNEADQFKNHHLARGSKFRDWDAAWRFWLGNARKFADARRGADRQAKPARRDPVLDNIARFANRFVGR